MASQYIFTMHKLNRFYPPDREVLKDVTFYNFILAKDGGGPGTSGWTSTDGSCWEPLPSQVGGLDAAINEDQVMVIDRTAYSELWIGTATGSGSC